MTRPDQLPDQLPGQRPDRLPDQLPDQAGDQPPARLSQLDAFFVAYQQLCGIPMQLGVELELSGAVAHDDVRRGLARATRKWPHLAQRLKRRTLGLVWDGPPRDVLHVGGADADAAAAIHRWRNLPIDPFDTAPLQALWIPGAPTSTVAIRAHHAAADGQALFAVVHEVLGGIADAPQTGTEGDAQPSWRRGVHLRQLPSMWKHVRWLARESTAECDRIAARELSPGDISIACHAIGPEASERFSEVARAARVSPAIWVCAAWARAIATWNASRGASARRLSVEFPISVRRGSQRQSIAGNFISPLVLITDATRSHPEIARDLQDQARRGLRQRSHLAVPLFTSLGRYLPWPVFRRMSGNTTFSGFATTHFTWLDAPFDPDMVRDATVGRIALVNSSAYTPVCLHMGAALNVVRWRNRAQLFLTYRESALGARDAGRLLGMVITELGLAREGPAPHSNHPFSQRD